MNGKSGWTGVAPSPQVIAQLDPEETAVLALLAWSLATNRPVTSTDLAELLDRRGEKLGLAEARNITKTLADLKVASVLGMNNDRPLSIFLGGFQPSSAVRRTDSGYSGRPGTGAPRPGMARSLNYPKAEEGLIIENKSGGLPNLRTTAKTPAFVPEEAKKLRERQVANEGGKHGDNLVAAAVERRDILAGRIALYERWLTIEYSHPILGKVLARKRKALSELEFQLERAKVKQAELEAERAEQK